MKEMPSNSHIHYNFLLSYATLPKWVQEYWYKHEAYTYVLLDSPERKEEIERAFPQLAEKYKTHRIDFRSYCYFDYRLDQLYKSDSCPFYGACQRGRSAQGSGSFPETACWSVSI